MHGIFNIMDYFNLGFQCVLHTFPLLAPILSLSATDPFSISFKSSSEPGMMSDPVQKSSKHSTNCPLYRLPLRDYRIQQDHHKLFCKTFLLPTMQVHLRDLFFL